MRIALGSDEANELTAFLIEELRKRGHSLVLRGPIDPADLDVDWPLTSSHVAELVARGEVVLVEEKLGVTMTEIIKADRS